MSSRRRMATTLAGVVLAIGLAGCGGDDKAEQTDSGTTTGSTSTGSTTTGTTTDSTGTGTATEPTPAMDPNMPGMNHPAGKM